MPGRSQPGLIRRGRQTSGGETPEDLKPLWVPSLENIPGLKAWYNPSNVASVTMAAGRVASIAPTIGDPSLALAHATAANRPIINTLGTKQVLDFPDDGSICWLEKYSATVPNRPAGLTTVIAFNPTATLATGRGIMTVGRASPNQLCDYKIITPGNVRFQFGEGAYGSIMRTYPVDEWQLLTCRDKECWGNGGDVVEHTTGNPLVTDGAVHINLGRAINGPGAPGGFTFVGQIGHFFIVTGVVDDALLRRIEGYSAWDLGIQDKLVTGHPHENGPPRVG